MNTELREFQNVTIYTPGNSVFSNIVRIDTTWAKIWIGPYAQHEAAVYMEFLRKGKRKAEVLVSSYRPYVVVVQTSEAIQPDDLYLPAQGGSSSTRYSAADSRWRTDFDEQLLSSGISIVADYRELLSEKGMQVVSERTPEVVVGSSAGAIEESVYAEGAGRDDGEFEEGLRSQAERSFFSRNAALVQKAKEIYGYVCQVCDFDFEKAYGLLGRGFIEVHHLNPLSERSEAEWTAVVRTSVAEVSVLCANCHRMIHRRRPAISPKELKAILSTADVAIPKQTCA